MYITNRRVGESLVLVVSEGGREVARVRITLGEQQGSRSRVEIDCDPEKVRIFRGEELTMQSPPPDDFAAGVYDPMAPVGD